MLDHGMTREEYMAGLVRVAFLCALASVCILCCGGAL